MYSIRIQNGAIWDSFFDIGKLVSKDEYLHTESMYVDIILEICHIMNIGLFAIDELENYDMINLREGQCIGLKELPLVVRSILRDRCWCKLASDSIEIHFGYDYIMYIVIKSLEVDLESTLDKYRESLVIDKKISPYLSDY